MSALIEEKLPVCDVASDGGLKGAAEAFKRTVKSFLLDEHKMASKLVTEMVEDLSGEKYVVVDQVARKIAGLTAEQLKVNIRCLSHC